MRMSQPEAASAGPSAALPQSAPRFGAAARKRTSQPICPDRRVSHSDFAGGCFE